MRLESHESGGASIVTFSAGQALGAPRDTSRVFVTGAAIARCKGRQLQAKAMPNFGNACLRF
jgi:hypothetical protein